MAAVTIKDKHETMPNTWAGKVTIATTGDTLETPFSRIVSVQITPIETTDATTYWSTSSSGGTATFNGGGTGFAGDWFVEVVGYR